ncbi:MAG: HEAT repeat domain-containing protein [Alphaproteobacteria bacterium]|nr:HEAT repeat domain-containing protein [Alphaproteobacteria bacterium]
MFTMFTRDPRRILAKLKDSVLFAPDFPQRPTLSTTAWAALNEDERAAATDLSVKAIERAEPQLRKLEDLINTLGRLRIREAIPLLSQIWQHSALYPVQQAAGRALLDMDDATAYHALEERIEDHDFSARRTAVCAIFHRDPLHAYDRLAPFFVRSNISAQAVARTVLHLFIEAPFRAGGGCKWYKKKAPSWLERDPRWLTLCAELCTHDAFGASARNVLRIANPDSARQALDAAREKRFPAPAAKTWPRGDLVARYRAGDHRGTWRDARECGAIAGALRDEIIALAKETMARVGRNADLLSERLQEAGWVSLTTLRTRPDAGDAAILAKIEQLTGAPLPPSLLAFWNVVGGINFVWDYDQDGDPIIEGLPLAQIDTDALWVDPCGGPGGAYELSIGIWEDQINFPPFHPELIDPFRVDLAPDRLMKMNVSGGAYAIELPFAGADPPFLQETIRTPFVDYLRDCFEWAGFPGLKDYPDRAAALRFVQSFGAGLEPF